MVKPSDELSVDGADDDPEVLVDENEKDLLRLQAARRAKLVKALALGLIAVLLITFAIQNADPVPINLLSWTVSAGLIWVIVIAAGLGAIAGYLVGKPPKNLRLHGPRRRRDDEPPPA